MAPLLHARSMTVQPVTPDGREGVKLIPLHRRRRFVPRTEFAAESRSAPAVSLDAFRADQETAADGLASSR
ncbi:prevent-host-death protein [Kitasatospora sp. NPDC094019]|uniref:prevent-host-death protein n=1 Tax=Kitasatospora sp. NPDC094019 TaxID=3364091 RepID=UPI00381DF890